MERLILDTSVLIAAERSAHALSEVIADDADVAICAITAAEMLVGVELADDDRRARRAAYVERVLGAVPVESYELDVARAHARLLAQTRSEGRRRGAHDLIIGATAIARRRVVVTMDERGFAGLADVRIRAIPSRERSGPRDRSHER